MRVFGEEGFVESINHGEIVRIVTSGGVANLTATSPENEASPRRPDFTALVLRELAGEMEPMLSIEDELHPTRMVNRAKASIALTERD